MNVLKHLRKAGITKDFGYACTYLFQLVFVLVFHHRNRFQRLNSTKSESFPGKDAVYRFLHHTGFARRRFLLLLSAETVSKTSSLTSDRCVSVFVVDDSMYERNRSKRVELLARFQDHARNCYYKGFRMLTLGWSDGQLGQFRVISTIISSPLMVYWTFFQFRQWVFINKKSLQYRTPCVFRPSWTNYSRTTRGLA